MATYLVDTTRDRIGELMGRSGGRYFLRPPGGGREWECLPENTRLPTPEEQLSAGVRAANRHSEQRCR
ncbi:hypothetical protein ACLIYM_28240 [Streptomyces fenghuangensis]|jgi:hypothetical protein|uniref:Uncharacterized protein n=3 Tax=Streptomyces TaxID=1883 RepID=A0A1H9B8B9_9ACTN|nr:MULTISPECIES: hypothetical protein [Streptomyces]MCG3042729.1 hypothetical protein [Streptomyces sp. ICN903]MDH2412452.1 hypothetical protein [Streptomyces chitinivorans]URN13587.1 hypothetical protein LUW77_25625 [Streptomyces radiopugnans]SEP85272.1 hypothetical protein SAMN05216481_102246 [Streptomyces radiopugnans]SFK62679.1 hypothetical protein SAMN05192584_107216 [Streptomyces pini]